MTRLKFLLGRQDGQAMVEYAYLITLIAIGVLISLQQFGIGLQGLYSNFPAAF